MQHVEVHLRDQSKPVNIENPINCYQKGDFYCVAYEKNGERKVQKFPLRDGNIFRIKEPYDLTQ